MKKVILGLAGCAALLLPAPTIAKSPLAFKSRADLAQYRRTRPVRHQFRQVMLPTGQPNQFRVGLWIMNPANGRIRLCLMEEEASASNAMKCSAWSGAGSPGRYRIMNIRIPRNISTAAKAGMWIVNYETGDAQACIIADLSDPTGTLKCSRSR